MTHTKNDIHVLYYDRTQTIRKHHVVKSIQYIFLSATVIKRVTQTTVAYNEILHIVYYDPGLDTFTDACYCK